MIENGPQTARLQMFKVGDTVRCNVGQYYGKLVRIVQVIRGGYYVSIGAGHGSFPLSTLDVLDPAANNGD
jgi:hypothetical protein